VVSFVFVCVIYFVSLFVMLPVSGRAVWGAGLDRLDTGIVGSNPAQGMNVCPLLSACCCPLQVEALRRADHSSKESYHMSK
jgi:predicted secreted protein